MKRSNAEDRAVHVELWRQSGLSRAAYCRQADIAYHSLSDWLKVEREHILAENADREENGFVQLALPDNRPRHRQGDVLSIACGDHFTIRVDAQCDQEFLKMVLPVCLSALAASC